ncbi:MAG: tetratricopeptide repeat protein [Dysgonamonadaceae bacterium]|jgi:tetratricopeptide (TPR) repeat protein|nr:tetratricopeptide repeat protein [Dysgonamonadaceae bacterium]
MLSIYQNSNADNYESIKAGFIVRTAEYETIISTLEKRKSGDSVQHELILGRRGSGKSTLLKRIEVEIAENEKLKTKYIPVNLAEEQAGVYRLMDLWEQVLKELYYWSEEKFEAKSFSEFGDEQAYTRYLYSEIHHFCETKKKKAVLLLDNFDRIVGNFSDDGNLLRETLINYHDLVLIAASTRMDEHFWSYDQPFYEFFRRHRLETLTSEEAFRLLNHWSDSLDFSDDEREKIKDFLQNNPGKVENIRLLTDGLPRTMLLFLKLVLQTEKPEEAYCFLQKVMDEVTPLYQERLLNQTAPMRKIILEMAFMWEAASTKEIAEQCRMESKRVAADLNTLTDRKIVETIATDKRNNLYRIGERFFNMWLIVTQGNPEQKRKARWVSEFLECWYDKQELQEITRQHIENLKTHKISGRNGLILTKALSQSKHTSTYLRDEMIDLTKADLKDTISNYMIQLPETIREIIKKSEHIEKTNYQQAIDFINRSIENEDGRKENIIGCIYEDQELFDLAEKYYLMAIEKENVAAMFNLGNLYYNQEKYDLAEQYYLQAIEKGDVDAIFNLGGLYGILGRFDLSEKYFLQAIKEGNNDAIFTLAVLYYAQNKNKKQAKQYISQYKNERSWKVIIEIWAGVFNAVEERVIAVCIKNEEDANFIERLLIHHQKSLVDKLFHHAEFGKRLQEQYTVLYYVSQILNGKEKENNLLLRIPPELQSTVDDVLQNIKSEQERYSK